MRSNPRVRASAAARSWLFGLGFLLGFPGIALAQAAALPLQVEAVFLFNFTQFVTWPSDAFSGPADPFVLCVIGEDPFGSYLDATVAGENVDHRPLTVRRLPRLEAGERCHIAYIGRSANTSVPEPAAPAHGMLTVSDTEDFVRRGGMIRFVVENRRVRLRINPEAAAAAGLTISSKLLRIAEIVGERP